MYGVVSASCIEVATECSLYAQRGEHVRMNITYMYQKEGISNKMYCSIELVYSLFTCKIGDDVGLYSLGGIPINMIYISAFFHESL